MSTNVKPRLFTAICTLGEQRQIIQLYAADQAEAAVKWIATIKSHGECILSPQQVSEFEQDLTARIIEPVACDGVALVWDCSNVIDDQLIDLLLVASKVCGGSEVVS